MPSSTFHEPGKGSHAASFESAKSFCPKEKRDRERLTSRRGLGETVTFSCA